MPFQLQPSLFPGFSTGSEYAGLHTLRGQATDYEGYTITDVRNRFFKLWFDFCLVFEKTQIRFGSVLFKKCGSVWIL